MNELLPGDADLELLHTRDYQVKAYRKNLSLLMLRGAVRDTKPAGMYVADDVEPLVVHHMIVELDVSFPSMEIMRAEVVLDVHPHATCPLIVPHYGKLVGLSISRGFTHKVRELFGGPRGCTHTTALLQAMAPVAIQSSFSMRAAIADAVPVALRRAPTAEERKEMFAFNINSCHVWDEHGVQATAMLAGDDGDIPLWIEKRYAKLGLDSTGWRERMRG